MNVPEVVFETPRLLLRHLQPEDVDALHAIFSDPVVVRWIGDGEPLTYNECERWIAVSQRNYEARGFGAFAVERREDGEFVGLCGIVYGPGRAEPELIYGFARQWWGQGYATEVVAPMLSFGLGECGLPRILANIDPDNCGSRRVAEKCGMRFEGIAVDERGESMVVYAIEAPSSA